ncbi:hypothetical protein SADUNF_Sadunf01G0021400 [Salix dunnii]|uniref:Phosphatase n=1 Tax=Salix dunnii TaxID=1413687 RepID=A0A835N9W9_9ROSI|nr:hypothetical protein SADUNF_Sadunf01G0021400 [Salix dunnii]
MAAAIVVVFDFDKTIIDVDGDNWGIDELGFTDLFNQLLPTMPWNSLMGLIIERIQASISKEGSKKIIYLGDGAGDYCPSLKLTEADYVMPRKNFPVWGLISKNPLLVKAEIHEWIDGEEMERVLLQIIERISREEMVCSNSAQLFSADCKLQTLSTASHGASPQALSVTQ